MDINLYQDCIYHVHPTTVVQIIKNESSFNPIAINVNTLKGQTSPRYKPPKTAQEAIRLAEYYVSLGHSVDLGFMQVNTNNLDYYGVTIADMFEPCRNINIGSRILYENYQRALKRNPDPSQALQIALSYYNTGSPSKGFENGYVDKYINTKIDNRVLTASPTISTQNLYQ